MVSLHWGNEYRSEPSDAQNAWLDQILPADEIDLVIGHHAHVVQPVDKVGDEWVVFGLGNFLSNQSPATRIDWAVTMPPSEITATSVVPPPMSTIMLPDGS